MNMKLRTNKWVCVLFTSLILLLPTVVHAQSWSLFGITGEQQKPDQTVPGAFDYPDHTLVRINTTNASCTDFLLATFAPDSQAIGYCATNALIYHTGGAGAYRDDPTRTVIDQDPNV